MFVSILAVKSIYETLVHRVDPSSNLQSIFSLFQSFILININMYVHKYEIDKYFKCDILNKLFLNKIHIL